MGCSGHVRKLWALVARQQTETCHREQSNSTTSAHRKGGFCSRRRPAASKLAGSGAIAGFGDLAFYSHHISPCLARTQVSLALTAFDSSSIQAFTSRFPPAPPPHIVEHPRIVGVIGQSIEIWKLLAAARQLPRWHAAVPRPGGILDTRTQPSMPRSMLLQKYASVRFCSCFRALIRLSRLAGP